MPEREARTVVGYTVDNASVQQAVAANEKVAASAAKTAKDANSAVVQFSSAEQAARALNLSAAQMEQLGIKAASVAQQEASSAQNQLATERQITAEMQKQIDANSRASRGGGMLGFGGADGRLATGYGTLRSAGAAIGTISGSPIGGQFAAGIGLAAELGAVGIAAAATAVILKTLTAEQERQTKVYESRLDIERSAAREVGELTTAQLQERVKSAERQLAIDKKVADQQLANALLYNLSIVDQPLKLGAALAGLDPLYNAYQGAIAKNNVALEQSQAQIDVYSDALKNNETAAADAAEAARLLADAQIASANQAVEIDRLTKEQRDERAAQNDREVNVLTRLIGAGDLSAETVAELADQITDLNEDTAKLNAVSESYADTLEREAAAKQAVTDQTDAYFEALKNEEQIRDKITEINADIARITLERDEKIAEALKDRDDRISEIISEGESRRGEITAEGEERRREIIADSNARIAKITRDAGRQLGILTAQRDALAFVLEQRRAADALSDEKENQGKALDQQKKGEEKSLDQSKKAQDKQLESARRAFDQMQQNLVSSSNRQLTTQYQGLRAQEVALQNNQLNLQSIALFGSNNRRVIETQLWQETNAIAVTWAANTVNSLRSIFGTGGSSSIGGGGGSGGIGISQFNRQFDRRFAQTIDTQGRFG